MLHPPGRVQEIYCPHPRRTMALDKDHAERFVLLKRNQTPAAQMPGLVAWCIS